MQTYSYFNSSIVNDETRVITNSEDVEFKKWINGWTEEIKSPEVWSDAVPEVSATFDAEGVELTSAVPAVPSQLISGGDVIETIIHPSHTPDPYVPPPPVIPQSITMRQTRLALLGAGLLDTVNAGMAGMGQSAQIEWEFASEVQRSNPLIGAMGAALGMTDAQLDDLFTLGSTL